MGPVRVKGKLPNLTAYLAVVGSRKATGYGLSIAERFSRVLASEKIAIVSGGAYGIDAAAHEGPSLAEERQSPFWAPAWRAPIQFDTKVFFNVFPKRVLLISEFSPFTPPMAYQFPMRNRHYRRAFFRSACRRGCTKKRGYDYGSLSGG